MTVTCESCGGSLVAFGVPADYRADAPVASERAGICSSCLDVQTLRASEPLSGEPAFDRVTRSFPAGEGGRAFALLLGTLPDVTLEKEAAIALRAAAERAGVDVHLAFDRLIAAADEGRVDPGFDLARRIRQFESLADEV